MPQPVQRLPMYTHFTLPFSRRAKPTRRLYSCLLYTSISVGGNLRSIGHKPDYSRWTGGIQNPWTTTADIVPTESGGYVAVVEVEDMSLVTSGNYQRYYELDGVRYHHLIDPDTLMPANYYSAVSVLAPDSGLADCLSTGLYCMPLEEGDVYKRQPRHCSRKITRNKAVMEKSMPVKSSGRPPAKVPSRLPATQ